MPILTESIVLHNHVHLIGIPDLIQPSEFTLLPEYYGTGLQRNRAFFLFF